MVSSRWRSVAISFNQWQSVPDRRSTSTRLSVSRQSVAINQWQSVPDCSSAFSRLSVSRQSVAISGNQWQSVPISGNQWQSVRWQSVATTSHTEIGGVLQGCRYLGTHSRRGIRWGIRRGIRRSTTVGGVLGGVLPSVAISGNHFPPEERFGHSTVM